MEALGTEQVRDTYTHEHEDGTKCVHQWDFECNDSGPMYVVADLAKDVMVRDVNEMKMERIVWVDSGLSFAHVWVPEETITERADGWDGLVTTVGQVVHETEDRVVLCMSHDRETGAWAQCFLIYKPTIKERRTL